MSQGIFGTTKAVYVNSLSTVNNVVLAANIISTLAPIHALILKSESMIEAQTAIDKLTSVSPEAGASLLLQIQALQG